MPWGKETVETEYGITTVTSPWGATVTLIVDAETPMIIPHLVERLNELTKVSEWTGNNCFIFSKFEIKQNEFHKIIKITLSSTTASEG